MATFHIIVPDSLSQAGLDILEAAEDVTYDAPGKMTREELLSKAADADGLIIRSATTVDGEMFDALSKVKAIARAGVGVDNIDLGLASERGVVVMNAPDGNTIATAEHTLAMMLSLARNIPHAHATMKEGRWDRKAFMGSELRGKTLAIVGFGRVGQAVAKRAHAFDMEVIAYDPYVKAEIPLQYNVRLVSLDEALEQADYITLHAVVTDDTREMINANAFAKMKDGVKIVNVARGALISDSDLAEAIKSGKVSGAALDVYSKEPPPSDNPLLGLDGVVHTPHLGASTEEAQIDVAVQATENLLAALRDSDYKNVMNMDVLDN